MRNLHSWKLYFFNEDYTENSGNYKIILLCIEKLQNIILKEKNEESEEHLHFEKLSLNLHSINENPNLYLSYYVLSKYIINEMLNRDIDIAIKCFSCAISEILHENSYDLQLVNIFIFPIETLIMNKFNLSNPPYSDFIDVEPEKIGHIIFLRGTVIRVGNKKTKVEYGIYTCNKCHRLLLSKNEFICRCRNRKAELVVDKSIFCDYQEIIIQEVSNATHQTLYVICKNKDVGLCAPGEIISLVGSVKVREERDQSYKLIIEANNIQREKEQKMKYQKNQYNMMEIEKLSKEKNLIGILIDAIFPSIVGNENILKGLLFSIFGGNTKNTGNYTVRRDIHTLLIGDPGLGKSKMLMDIVNAIPKTTYVCGTMATAAGLTVSLIQEDGDFIIDAGALVISDGGICAVDEFDKMQIPPILDVMDEQIVSIAKGGIVCEIPARTTIIAAANPKYGQFSRMNKRKKLMNSIKFEMNVISRFDLVFIMKDSENKLNDDLLQRMKDDINEEKVIKQKNNITDYIKKETDTNVYYTQMINRKEEDLSDILISSKNEEENISAENSSTDLDNLISNINRGGEIDSIICDIRNDSSIIRHKDHSYKKSTIINYITYARNTISPQLTLKAKDEIYKYYSTELKECTLRELESLIRLTEANAKIYLREMATEEDVREIIELYRTTLIGSHEHIEEEEMKSKKSKSFIDMLKEKGTDEFFESELRKIYEESDIKKPYDRLLYQLNETGILIKKAKNLYRLII